MAAPAQTIEGLWRDEAAKLIAALTRLVRDVAVAEELAQDALVAALEGIQPSKLVTLDGPFTESKELIAGFSLINAPSKEAALAWAERYGAILVDLEVDVLALHDVSAYDGTKA